jgi:hypothetical protein
MDDLERGGRVGMGKKESHKEDLRGLFKAYVERDDVDELTAYLAANSALPSPRANLELAAAFGEMVEETARTHPERMWALCTHLSELSAKEAPTNDPQEFLAFCGAVGIGAVGAASADFLASALAALRGLARDTRWRMREAVAMALQRLLRVHPQVAYPELERWVAEGDLLEMRASAAAVADPVLLASKEYAHTALRMHEAIMDHVVSTQDRRSEAFQALRKGLSYTWSLVICGVPLAGFRQLEQLMAVDDPDVRWIVKEVLEKDRLQRYFPSKVASMRESLLRRST